VVRHDGTRQLEAEDELPRVAVDFLGRGIGFGTFEVQPGLIPQADLGPSAVDAQVHMLGDQDAEKSAERLAEAMTAAMAM
jgi:hypothetical protein